MPKSPAKPKREPTNGGPHATRWTATLDAMLGTVPDHVAAAAANCSNESARRRRARLGVPAHRPEIAWTAKADAVVGSMPVAKAAARLGTTPNAVRVRRSRLGLRAGDKRPL